MNRDEKLRKFAEGVRKFTEQYGLPTGPKKKPKSEKKKQTKTI